MDRGAHFRRTDLQVHSPRDRRWAGADCVSEAERQAYSSELVSACRAKGLDAIAITDHHDLLFVRYVRDAAAQERDAHGDLLPESERLTVFPGMELTLAVPCQAIVIFDADFPTDLFSLVLTALAITPAADNEAKTAQTERLDHIRSLEDIHAELDKHAYLKGRYIVLPNVGEGGTDTLLRSGAAGKYRSMPCVGGYLDGPVSQLGTGNQNILSGRASQYGNKRLALFQTSDNRSATHAGLGVHSTWIKWAVPTAEALRQACLAQESRVAQAIPQLPTTVITRLSVSNSSFLGPIELELNNQYNALIGGRGTGKSSILEYLRWALCDQLPDVSADAELPNYQRRRKSLIDQTLTTLSATAEVEFTINGIPHVVRRSSASPDILLKIGTGEFERRTEADVRSLLPIQAYSQKQLSNVSVRLEELTRFIEAPIRGALDDLARRLDRNGSETRQIYATWTRKRRLLAQLANDELQLRSLTDQAAALRGSLAGLSPEDLAVLDDKPRFDAADEVVDAAIADVGQVRSAVEHLSATLERMPTPMEEESKDLPEPELIAEIRGAVAVLIGQAKAAIANLSAQVGAVVDEEGEPAGTLLRLRERWENRRQAHELEYEAAKARASSHESKLRDLAALERRINELRGTIAATRTEVGKLGSPEGRLAELRANRIELDQERVRLLGAECERLTERAGDDIRARLDPAGGAERLADLLRDAMVGSGIRRDRLERVAAHISASPNPAATWQSVLQELEFLAQRDQDNPSWAAPATPELRAAGLAPQDIERFSTALSEDAWLALALTPLDPHPIFEFRRREAEYIPFENASAGQQATALLKALLNQPGPPLIIDQPEEDLDNPVILDVVTQLWKAKSTRQLIFVSHNANLVVNGDAELVIWCDYRSAGDHAGGKISGQGAIDMPAVCDAIKRVMEGGEAAFKLRRDKYGF